MCVEWSGIEEKERKNDGGVVQFCVPMIVGLILAGIVPAIFAWLIGLPVLKLKSDYLAIGTAGTAAMA